MVELDELPEREHVVFSHSSVLRRQQVFGYTHEEMKLIIAPMAKAGAEPIGSMGTDTPIAVLSERPRLLFDYFQQLFAQVTNPPLDAIREEVVTSVGSTVGPEANLLAPGPESCRQLVLPFPVIDNDELAKIIHINDSTATCRRGAERRTPTSPRSSSAGCTGWPAAAWRCSARSTPCAPRSARRSTTARGSSCSAIATATRSTRRSPACC